MYPYPDSPDLYFAWRNLGFNLIRLPVAWGYIQDGLQGPLNETTLGELDNLVNIITSNGSTVILDLVSSSSSIQTGVSDSPTELHSTTMPDTTAASSANRPGTGLARPKT